MASVFNMYPMLTSELIKESGFSTKPFEFSYIDDNEDFPINIEDFSGTQESFSARLQDPRCVWYPSTNNLIVRKSCEIKNPTLLFGKNGIAPKDAVLGVAIIWISSKSDQRGAIPCGSVSAQSNNFEFSIEHQFEKNCVKGSLLFQLVVYLKKSGKPTNDELHLNNTSGVMYGIIEQCEIFIDGNGSVFPISTVNMPGEPLWWVYYDESVDPMVDLFDDENVGIRLNRAHPLFDLLKIDASLKDSPFFIEVLSSALLVMINSVRDGLGPDWEGVIESQDFVHGSIAEAIYYFIHKLQWDISSQANLSKSIHLYFEKTL